MPSIKKILGVVVVGLAIAVSALPAAPKLSDRAARAYNIAERQIDPATGLPDGLGDVDILQLYVISLAYLVQCS